MALPRWQERYPMPVGRWSRSWDRFVALWAGLNLLCVAFDISYVPLRTFWLQRNLYPIPSVPLVVPLAAIPDITPWVDPIKGIEPHRETQAYLRQFRQLDAALRVQPVGAALSPAQLSLLQRQRQLTLTLIETNPFLASEGSGTLEKIKSRLRQRVNTDSARDAARTLFSPAWLQQHGWQGERLFWQEQVLPLVATNYWRSIDGNGRPTDHFWRIDLLLFQSVFALDILLRVIRLRRRLPGLSWRDALLRRWIDLPLLLPFWRWLRLLPVVERLQSSGLITIEPLRAVVSRAVVALLAVELFEVLVLQLLDGAQGVIRSRQWPQRIRSLCSHQSVSGSNEERELAALVRIWAPLLLSQVLPRLGPELQGVLGYALKQSFENSVVPAPLRPLQPLLGVETGLGQQLASGMVESLLDLSKKTGQQLSRRDQQQLDLLQRVLDRFWEELAVALEQGEGLARSQELLCVLIDGLKGTYLSQISRSSIESLIRELDALTTAAASADFPASAASPKAAPATPQP
ncbi:hypothetical protein KBY58_09290 [Cyanobium sp. HWJ4-Hawea]|uniref:hypothetical protein n=1 Tax=Cyanobium sp. HWJ4-Hawea TaxID=2823713 RepID=UPI0020CD3988|nr:hypothetical protein [Cyanobium sp. HWJ4-Hawea]MCP9809624.1 hypothetical protein [Cyanobium sp. HWJ4-Hawea]